MWTCPNCGKTFQKTNQSHYCGEKPKTIDEYILRQDPEKQPDLCRLREIVRTALPEAQEKISWSMPTYWHGCNLIQFAASKNHIGLYPGAEAVAFFQPELQDYKTDKGTIRIPYGKIDPELIGKIARWCWENNKREEEK